HSAAEDGALPLVLSGNCNAAVGVLAGLQPTRPAVVWFDAHGDYNTPETTVSGFLDGMALAIATGRCWRSLASTVPGFEPSGEDQVALVGARDVDAGEAEILEKSAVRRIRVAEVRSAGVEAAFGPALAALESRSDSIYLHLDLDVLDPDEAPANPYR